MYSFASLTNSPLTMSEPLSSAISPAVLKRSRAYLASPSSLAASAAHKGITSSSNTFF